ncbi:hypothetical protein KAW80_03475 [Candidatus Babeliales bacterium]|nr:hypothetical protein [Candidatus Babeliales bacterium]
MFRFNFKTLLLVSFLFVGIIFPENNIKENGKNRSLYHKIANDYLKSYDVLSSNDYAVDSENSNTNKNNEDKRPSLWRRIFKKKREELNKNLLENAVLPEKEQEEIILKLFSSLDTKPGVVASDSLWKDLEIFYGLGSNSSISLFSKVDRTKTLVGKFALTNRLVSPDSDIETLRSKQGIIKELVNNEESFSYIDKELENASKSEERFLFFWKEYDEMTQKFIDKNYFKKLFPKTLNQDSVAMEASVRSGNMRTAFSLIEPFIYYIFGMASVRRLLATVMPGELASEVEKQREALTDRLDSLEGASGKNLSEEYRHEAIRDFKHDIDILDSFYDFKCGVRCNYHDVENFLKNFFSVERWKNVKNNIKNHLNNDEISTSLKIGPFVFLGIAAFILYQIYPKKIKNAVKDDLERTFIARHFQKQLIEVATFIRSMKNIYLTLSQNSITTNIPALGKLERLFSGKNSKKLDKLVALLSKNTFEGESSFFSLTGRVFAANKLMLEVKDELAEAMEALGEIDTYMSVARLYKEFQGKESTYSFVNFVEGSKPYVRLKNFWNPFISPDIVVRNDLELGGQSVAKNIILTGPNAGGKSTVLKAATINVLFAQALGIAPSEEIEVTPFAKINTYLNVTDDLASGNSLFKAEVLRAQSLVKTIKDLKGNEFSFSIMDEMFSGTSPKEGEAASYTVSKSLSKNDNSMCLIATHFPKMTDLEKDTGGRFENYKVKVIKNSDASLSYPYKLEKGITDQHIAFDILANEGVIDSLSLAEAQGLLQ